MARKQFTFYRSFWDAIKGLNQKDRLSTLEAICAYALDGEERKMTPTAAGLFVLIKPVLDSAEKKSSGGKRSASNEEDADKITASNGEDTRKEKEGEKEKEKEKEVEVEKEKENECYIPTPTPPAREAVAYFLDRINPAPSSALTRELLDFCEALGDEVVLHALHIAVDERKTSWSYIKAILNRYKADGLTDINAVLAEETRHAAQKEAGKGSYTPGKEKRPYGANNAPRDDAKAIEQIRKLREKMNAG